MILRNTRGDRATSAPIHPVTSLLRRGQREIGVFFLCRDMCCRQLLDIHQIYLNNYSTMSEFTSDYVPCRDLLLKRLREPAPGRIQLLTGPRQVGKTTLLLEIARPVWRCRSLRCWG